MLSNAPPRLETVRLVLEPLVEAHADELFARLSDAELYHFIPTEPYASIAELRARFAHVARGPAASDERWWNWAIATRETPRRVVGMVELSLQRHGERTLLAYTLGRDAWGCGYAREACSAALAYLRASLAPLGAVAAYVDTRNARSIALLERLGFAREGVLTNADYFKGGPSDEFVYGLTLREG